jgi:outer membrane protein assembly factor BamB
VVSSPVLSRETLIFGDGMHQTDGAVLHCLHPDTGMLLWQLKLPGRLVHLESSPAIAGDRVYMSGGNAGVFCVARDRVILEGQERELSAAQTLLEKRWKELQERYEQEKKADPDFAVPPSEDQLPVPSPKVLWHQGKDRWHVDAAVAVVGEKVLAASSFLEEERVGERRIYCLRSQDGTVVWQQALRWNPWSGPTVAGNVVVVGCSSIRFDPKAIPAGRGQVAAFDLENGTPLWDREVPGGVLGPIAVSEGLAIFTGTDGKIRAWDIRNGQERWSQSGGGPFFAGPAVVAGIVYVADLHGVVKAYELATGKPQWSLDVAKDPAVAAPGMVYGSPIVHKRRIYLATCNLEGDHARQPAVVVCIGEQ